MSHTMKHSMRILVLDDNLKSVSGAIERSLKQFFLGDTLLPELGQLEGKESNPIEIIGLLELPVAISFVANRVSEEMAYDVKLSIEKGKYQGLFDIILLDDNWRGNEFGGQDVLLKEVYTKIKGISEELPLICLFTKHWDDDRLRRFYKLVHEEYGSWSRIIPCNKNDHLQLLHIFYRAITEKGLLQEREAEKEKAKAISKRASVFGHDLEKELPEEKSFCGIVGSSPQMLQIYDFVREVAPKDTTILLRGETGTGKELVARALHQKSDRSGKELVIVNCPTIPKELIESELFGHVKGAFTGAFEKKEGKFELADGGTIFLDEIGDMSLEAQAKVLRVLEEGEVQKVGSNKIRKVDVRVIAATNKDLESNIEDGSFREDLFYRLRRFQIYLPPLRERKEDISLIFHHLMDKRKEPKKKISEKAWNCFMTYNWPGNVRDLDNIIEHVIIVDKDDEIDLEDLPDYVRNPRLPSSPVRLVQPEVSIKDRFQSDERIFRAQKKLDEYEDACQKLVRLTEIKQKHIAEIIGIAPGAVSQICGEYKNEISVLLDTYTENWPCLRKKTNLQDWGIRKKRDNLIKTR